MGTGASSSVLVLKEEMIIQYSGKSMSSVKKIASAYWPTLRYTPWAMRSESSASTIGETKRMYSRQMAQTPRMTPANRKNTL